MTPNYVRDVLLPMDNITRRALLRAARDKVNADPTNSQAMTRILWAVASEIIDLDHDEAALLAELERES